jgi:hypothetical protein
VLNTDKVTKLIKMLTSLNDGEVVASARALLRTLAADGHDIHDLAKRIENGGGGGISPAERARIYEEALHRARREARREAERDAAARTTDTGPSYYQMACEIQRKEDDSLSEKERGFVADMVRWCARREPSEKQAKWLHSIYCRVGRS